jgi:hypothetical protein
MRERLPFPERIANAPRLQIGLELYYEAFWELGSCRAFGMSLGPIPWTAIQDYARAFDLDEKQREDLVYYVRVMDLEYLKFHAPKKPAKTATKGKWWRPQRHSDS